MPETFPRAELVTEDPIVEEAKAMRNRRQPITLEIAFHLVDVAMEEMGGRSAKYNPVKLPGQPFGSVSSCVNWAVDDETGYLSPSCIVGHVFAQFVPMEPGSACLPASPLNSYFIVDPITRHGRVFTEEAIQFLRTVQRSQDQGYRLGEAVDGAKARFLDLLPGKG